MSLASKKAKIIAGIAAAVLTVVLVLVAVGAPGSTPVPGDRVVATLNGEEITEKDVYQTQVKYWWAYGQDLPYPQALELLILQKLLYREAEQGGYVPTVAETEHEWTTQLGLTLEQIKAQLEVEGLSYDEYFEDFRTTLAIHNLEDALYAAIEVTEEEAWELYEELKETEEELEPFEEMKSELIEFLKYERWLVLVREIRNNADIEYEPLD